jgi:carbamoyl-phosphate synthase/aspartate carbamoyltransferase
MGGQTPNNIALPLHRMNVKILGTSPEMIDTAENRYKFSRMLDRINVDQPAWKELTSIEEATEFCERVSYPVLVRPSYVLSGAAMNTVYSQHDLANYLNQAADVSKEHPVVITKYIENAKEIEMDAVARNGVMIGHFISEHVENAGVHSGDATLILPPQDLDPETIRQIEEATRKIGSALNITGPYNIQFIAKDNEIKVIECNVRASRSTPFVSKVMGVDLIEMATKAMAGLPLVEYPQVTIPKDYVGVKVPQFSFSRLSGADPVLGVEMASTGEVACFGRTKYEAYLKGLIATGFRLPNKNILFSIGSFKDKLEMLPSIQSLHKMGFNLFATAGTADYIQEHGLPVKFLEVLPAGEHDEQKSEYSLTQHLSNNLIDLYINLPSSNRFRRPANYMSRGYRTRRMAVDYQTPLVTNVKNAKLLIEAISRHYDLEISEVDFQEFVPAPGANGDSYGQDSRLNSSLSLPQLLAKSPFKRKHITSVKQFTRADLHLLFTIAQEMRLGAQRHGCLDILKGRVLCTMFFEPSTRTSGSFDAAMKRLGGEVITINESVSSTKKGESIADTIRTLGCYGDAIVLRHPHEDSIDIASKFSSVPVINAGNGSREHPTQALLDIFTIREELGTVKGLNITFVGDLKYGRTVHSLCELLSHYNVTVNLVSPKGLGMPSSVRDALDARGQLREVSNELTPEIVAASDVLYCTRVQKERFPDAATYEAVKDSFVIDNKVLKGAKTNMIVMHPLPRNNEIHEEVDFDPRAAYFRQVSSLLPPCGAATNTHTDALRPVHAHGAACYGDGVGGSRACTRHARHRHLISCFDIGDRTRLKRHKKQHPPSRLGVARLYSHKHLDRLLFVRSASPHPSAYPRVHGCVYECSFCMYDFYFLYLGLGGAILFFRQSVLGVFACLRGMGLVPGFFSA